ncbi:MAG TPA: IS200/IS605 family transposase [Deltaproteobacteria bacterium]|nr:IS200/IS605 family transposase [Deltaproteobacteria bacterium]HQO81119.1 IS200/IS605 family transposase [Deltaproteobacteria bacterium]
MKNEVSLSHTRWECKNHIVWIPKYRKKVMYHQLRNHLGEVIRNLARHKESEVIEGHLMPDHIHMLISIPPKYSVSQVIGYMKGKSAIHIARSYLGRRKNFTGQHFWARGYYVSTVGLDEDMVRSYIKKQEQEDQRLEQLNIFS